MYKRQKFIKKCFRFSQENVLKVQNLEELMVKKYITTVQAQLLQTFKECSIRKLCAFSVREFREKLQQETKIDLSMVAFHVRLQNFYSVSFKFLLPNELSFQLATFY